MKTPQSFQIKLIYSQAHMLSKLFKLSYGKVGLDVQVRQFLKKKMTGRLAEIRLSTW